jgi:hypothetical protein
VPVTGGKRLECRSRWSLLFLIRSRNSLMRCTRPNSAVASAFLIGQTAALNCTAVAGGR